MPRFEATYSVAPRGRATSFTESELPPEFSLEMKNRFINAAGGAEKRQGIVQLGSTVDGTPSLNGIHELVTEDDTAILLVSGQGQIWRYDDPGYTLVKSGLDVASPLRSMQMEEKLIFFNGVDRNIYTEDGTTFKELKAIIERGVATTGTDTNSLHDTNVDNWVTDSNVAINDLLYNATKDAYAVISAVATASVGHTAIGPGVPSAIGVAVSAQEVSDDYEIIDLVELNVIPTGTEDDNVATAGAGTTDNVIVVSAVSDWTGTDVCLGDYVRNTTRVGTGRITNVSAAAVHITGVSAQVAGDSLIFMKSAMPITKYGHVHFGRGYYADARDLRLIRVTGANNPEDMTTTAGTIDSSTFKYGSTQPQADSVLAMSSFQRFFAMAGRQNLYFFEGTDPIQDVSADSIDFNIIGLFPQGCASPDAIVSIGNDEIWATPDGVQSVSLAGDASTLGRANLSESIKVTLREEIANTPEAQIKAWHYPRRSWFMLKVGTQIHVFNYVAYFGQDQLSSREGGTFSSQRGSWSLYDGKFARQNDYLVRRDKSMVCCGGGGKVYTADSDGAYDDDGEPYGTEYQTGWLTLEPKERRGVRTKQGNYIKPIFDTGADITYSIRAEAGFDLESSETISINTSGGSTPIGLAEVGIATIGGTSIQNRKRALRWRGEQVRLTWTTNDNLGPDTLSRYTLYATSWGMK